MTIRKCRDLKAYGLLAGPLSREYRVADLSMIERDNLLLETVRIWVGPEQKERRTLHHRGNRTPAIDCKIIDLHERMVL
ncbi:hypothetical protein BIWAKO_05027 [Bosea sp. BIWAKO-01]|nr:hypothetical protein BIWAKO_05027 [Bosea sp. BIWAKO-01]